MNTSKNTSLDAELRAFSLHDWDALEVFVFTSIPLSVKKDRKGQWYIQHSSSCIVFVDSEEIISDSFEPVSQYDHFLQIKQDALKEILVLSPTKSSLVRFNGILGARITAKRFTRIFTNRKKVSGIQDLSFTIYPSEFVGIYGESGIGKSVLINSILGTIHEGHVKGKLFTESASGEKILEGEISYLPQIINIPPHLTCKEILQAAMIDRSSNGACNITEIKDVLHRCSLDESILPKYYRQISEGQKRRLCIASTLLKKHSKLLIADEPTTGLDVYSEEQVMETLRSISRSGITVLVVTHSVTTAPIMDRVLVLKKRSSEQGATIYYSGPIRKNDLEIISNVFKGIKDNQELSLADSYTFPDPYSYLPPQTNDVIPFIKASLISLRIIPFQGFQWFFNVLKIIYRDKKSVLIFMLLALVCVLTIQFGTNGYIKNNPENILVTLFTLAAPWLCAMYAAISVSELNRYFAWEHFSGLRSVSFLLGTAFAHVIPAVFIGLIFSLGLFVSPRNSDIVKRWICRGMKGPSVTVIFSDDLTIKEYSLDRETWIEYKGEAKFGGSDTVILRGTDRLGNISELSITRCEEDDSAEESNSDSAMPKETNNILNIAASFGTNAQKIEYSLNGKDWHIYTEKIPFATGGKVFFRCSENDGKDTLTARYEDGNIEKMAPIVSNRLWFVNDMDLSDNLDTCLDYAKDPVAVSQWYTRLITGSNYHKLDKAILYSPLFTLYDNIYNTRCINYPLADKTRDSVSCWEKIARIVLILCCISWVGSVIGITSAIILGNAKNAAVSIIVVFIFYILFSRLFITKEDALTYLQPLAEIASNTKTIPINEVGVIIPVFCSFICLGRYTSNILVYAFTTASLHYDIMALCGITLFCLVLSFIVLARKKLSK